MATRTVAQVATSFKRTSDEVVEKATELGFDCKDADSELELAAIKALGAVFRGGQATPPPRKAAPKPVATNEQQIHRRQNASSRTNRGGMFGSSGGGAATVVVKSGARSAPVTAEIRPNRPTPSPADAASELRRQAQQIRDEETRRRQAEQREREERELRLKQQKEEQARAAEAKAKQSTSEGGQKRREQQDKSKATPKPKPGTQSKAAKGTDTSRPGGRTAKQGVVKERAKTSSDSTADRRNGRRGVGLREFTKGDDERARSPRSRRRTNAKPLDRVAELDQGGDFQRPSAIVTREVEIGESILVGALAQAMSIKASELIMKLMDLGVMATINDVLDRDTATIIIEELGHKVKLLADQEDVLIESTKVEGDEEPRPPVVTVMGHVDHGKTSLLDYIRKTQVAAREAGGITQHIGAYHLTTDHGNITFLDTPGHAAFSSMRARGANSTDIVVLVCAADDGVMPQTEEAVYHAKAAGVPIIVAVNKIDIDGVDPQRVRAELTGLEVIPEELGGDTQFINVSAETGEGIEELLEAISLQADLMELKAVHSASGRGLVLESKLEKGRGAVVSLLVQNGTLKQGDIVLAGEYYGRVRSLIDDQGNKLKEAPPSIPVEMLGFNGTPDAGDAFSVAADERQARQLAATRAHKSQHQQQLNLQKSRLENMFQNLGKGEKRILNVVLKADVRGSLEAIIQALADIGNDEVGVNVLGSGIGGINESDVNMAITYDALIFGFDVRPDKSAKSLIDRGKLEVRYYRVIYELIDDVKAILTDMLIPDEREEIVGSAEVREVFTSPRYGQIAGCLVVDGTVYRNKKIRVLRDNIVIFEGELESLRRFKDDVQEVSNGTECGIGVRNYRDVRAGDLIEVYETQQVARSL